MIPLWILSHWSCLRNGARSHGSVVGAEGYHDGQHVLSNGLLGDNKLWDVVGQVLPQVGSLQCPVQPLAGFLFGLVRNTKGHLHLVESPSQMGPLNKYLLRTADAWDGVENTNSEGWMPEFKGNLCKSEWDIKPLCIPDFVSSKYGCLPGVELWWLTEIVGPRLR